MVNFALLLILMAKKKNIAVDIGNSRIKSGEFVGDELQSVEFWDSLIALRNSKATHESSWSFCTVRGNGHEISQIFEAEDYYLLDHQTSIPIVLNYKTPESLGMDRVAAMVGAQGLFPNRNLLVIDFGTCNTYDVLDKEGVFVGGVIAPGFKLRMRAMHHYTKSLPDISEEWESCKSDVLGQSTIECLKSGAFDATIMEIEGFIDRFNKEWEDLTILLTGGDAPYFESMIKGPIFARSNLVLRGLNRIMHFNNA